METTLPLINACLNCLSLILIIFGLIKIRQNNSQSHRILMLSAFASSTLFLSCYLFYHYNFQHSICVADGWIKYLYFIILFPHIILAIVMLPLIFITFFYAFKNKLIQHKKIAKITFPIWIYVSLTGVIIYLYVYIIFPDSFKKAPIILTQEGKDG